MTVIHPFGPIISRDRVSDEFLSLLQATARASRTARSMGHSLAGNIESQTKAVVDSNLFMQHLYPHIVDHVRACYTRLEENMIGDGPKPLPGETTTKGVKHLRFHLGQGPWVNYQQPNEFNPIHAHGGTLSVVIMIDVPEEIAKEAIDFKDKSNMPCAGQLEFFEGSTSWLIPGTWKVIPKTGDMYILPAELKHAVYPFKSNVERITMSLNIFDILRVEEAP